MIPAGPDPFHGIYAATPCPLDGDLAPDEPTLAAHLDRLAGVPGLAGFLLNGHAGENAAMSHSDQKRVMAVAAETVGGRSILVAGVNCENSLDAARHARAMEAAGADALMVFPPNGWALHQDEEGVVGHHRRVLDATGAPVMLFQAAVGAGGLAYPASTLERLARLPRVVAIKEGSWEVAAYEEHRRLVRSAAPGVAVMGSGDEHLFTSCVIGSEGSIVSLAAVIPEPIIGLHEARGAGRRAPGGGRPRPPRRGPRLPRTNLPARPGRLPPRPRRPGDRAAQDLPRAARPLSVRPGAPARDRHPPGRTPAPRRGA